MSPVSLVFLTIWKSVNNPNYPLQWDVKKIPLDGSRSTRSRDILTINEKLQTGFSSATFLNDAARIWNLTPRSLRESTSIYSAKKYIKQFASALPI